MKARNLNALFAAQYPQAQFTLSLTKDNRLCIDYTAPSDLKYEIEVFLDGLQTKRAPKYIKYHGKAKA